MGVVVAGLSAVFFAPIPSLGFGPYTFAILGAVLACVHWAPPSRMGTAVALCVVIGLVGGYTRLYNYAGQ